ncbi:MAG TPA: hypothetical protein VFU45_03075 [Gemmatimonadales bacterium]|nr:hypothetical protein [Gemmatimonadales bacterium]
MRIITPGPRRVALLVCGLVLARPLMAQQPDTGAVHPPAADSLRRAAPDSIVPTRPQAPDSTLLKPPITPMGAFFRSLAVPGWGQATLGRKLTGGIMVAWEGVTLGMTVKTSHELAYYENIHSPNIPAKEQERQDWLVLLVFNHLFSGLEAYVSAHLWDFPPDLHLQALPHGVGGSISLPPVR